MAYEGETYAPYGGPVGSAKEICLRSLKRTHTMYLSNYGQRPDFEEPCAAPLPARLRASAPEEAPCHTGVLVLRSLRLKMMAKVQAEYRMVKDLPPPSAAGGSKGGVTSAAPAAGAPSQGMLTDKSGSGAGGSTSLVKSTPATAPVAPNAGRTLGIRRNQVGLDVPKPEWHAPWKLMRVVSGHLGWVRAIAVDPTNEWFVTGSADRTIKVWDLASGVLKLTLTGHISTIRGLAVSPRSPYLFSAGEDKMVKCWDLEYNRVIRNYHGHLSGVRLG